MSENYCYIENGVIEKIQPLPKEWKNISGFNLLTDLSVLKKHGWLPFEEVHPSYNNKTHYRIAPSEDIQESKVVFTDRIVAFTAEEIKGNNLNDWNSGLTVNDRFEAGGLPRVVEDLMIALNTFDPEILKALPRDSDGVSVTEEKFTAKKAHRDSKP